MVLASIRGTVDRQRLVPIVIELRFIRGAPFDVEHFGVRAGEIARNREVKTVARLATQPTLNNRVCGFQSGDGHIGLF
ncbi:hypothetical protein WT27_00520 [Burkholderia territorii]|uniref:Uncharacterized protein n=1 Tax=Burkholderia territorii TaxID=1503055 RepID=A0A105VC76_9BURK|nr:hypothetical protein WT27_00520 [Burkholderia territorii]KVX47035.1 hypothetical protein WT31_20860 [Burkholderia territorii]